jgi:hypothetical protein
MHALSGIRSHGLSVQAIKAYASDHAATGTLEDVMVRCVERMHI